jgi:hypothetical protein
MPDANLEAITETTDRLAHVISRGLYTPKTLRTALVTISGTFR